MNLRQAKIILALIAFALLGANQVVYGFQCRFHLAPYTYDLCPILFAPTSVVSVTPSESPRQIHVHQDILTPPTVTRQEYGIDFGGEGLPRDGTLPATEQCPTGTWICFRSSNTRPDHPSEPRRILQVIPVAGNIPASSNTNEFPRPLDTSTGVNTTVRFGSKNISDIPSLEMTLNGGQYLSRLQRAVFTFLCDKSIEEPSLPVPALFLRDPESSSPEGTFSLSPHTHPFTWRTAHACPIGQDKPEKSHTGDGSGTEDGINPEVPLSDTALIFKKRMGGVVVGCLMMLALVSYLVYALRSERRNQPYTSLTSGRTTHSPSRLPFSIPTLRFFLPPFLYSRGRARRKHARSEYDPFNAEEYEIQNEDGEAVQSTGIDVQRQGLLQGFDTKRGYGSVR